MDAKQATAEILEAGKSGELNAAFRCVAEATTLQGEARYGPRVCRHLARLIVCRTYAGTVLQLCHLIVAADACGQGRGRYENFFFGCEPASPAAFVGHIDATLAAGGWRRSGFERGENGIIVSYRDGVFNVEFGRMPLLAALFEFLIATVSYAEIEAIIATMLEQPESQDAVAAAASGIEGLLYRYLNQHLPSVQNQTKFSLILDFFKRRTAAGGVIIDDATILEFWQENACLDEGRGNFRLFRTVSDAFVSFRRALQAAQEKAAAEAGTAFWRRPRSRRDRSRGVAGTGRHGRRLALAARGAGRGAREPRQVPQQPGDRGPGGIDDVRSRGPRLAAVAAALRGLRPQPAPHHPGPEKKRKAAVPDLITCRETPDYGAWCGSLAVLEEHLEQIIKAALHVMLRPAREDVIKIAPANDYEHSSEPPLDKAAIADVLAEAKQAFRGFSRQGFDEGSLDDADVVAAFEAGVDALVASKEQIGVFLERLARIDADEVDLGHWFEQDRKVFAGQFARLYGEPS